MNLGWESRLSNRVEKRLISQMSRLCTEEISNDNTISSEYKLCPWVEYKISKTHLDLVIYLGSISCALTAAAPWSPPPRSSWSQWPSSSPWLPPPCPARARSPGGCCWCGPRDISGWCHFHPSSVTILCCNCCIAIDSSRERWFSIQCSPTSQLQSVTPSAVTPDFLISDVKLSRSVITFRFLLFLRQKRRDIKRIFQIFQTPRKNRITRNCVLLE